MCRVLLLSVVLVAIGGCTRANPDFVGSDTTSDGAQRDLPPGVELGVPPLDGGRDLPGPQPGQPAGVDVLIVVDNSGGMSYPQQWLARDIDTLIAGLDQLPGGPNYRIGVTTTDMGVGAYGNAGCTSSGDSGQLVVPLSCPKPQGQVNYVQKVGKQDNVPGTVLGAVSCFIRDQGTNGCGFEQPLKAIRAALTVTNKGFLRGNSALAVLVLTNEDDCSALSNSLFNPNDPSLGPYSSYRCFQHGVLCNGQKPPLQATLLSNCEPAQQWLYDVKTHYADLLKALRPPGWVSVQVIGGPTKSTIAVEKMSDYPPWYAVKESCSAGELEGFPGLRLEELVGHMGAYGGYSSICASAYRPALKNLLTRIQAAF
jgi:hypothetical protein